MRRKAGNRPRSSGGSGGSRKKGSAGGWFQGNIILVMILRLLLVLLLFFLSRIAFFLFNFSYFADAGAPEVIKLLVVGLRFDISALLIINAPFILMMALPITIATRRGWLLTAHLYYCLINSLALMTNFIDTIYFRFTLKRMTADIFSYMGVGGDFEKLIPQFLKDFWFIAIIWIGFTVFLVWSAGKFRVAGSGKTGSNWFMMVVKTLLLFVIIAVSVVGIRGGLQLRPIGLVTAGNYTSGKYIPLVLNTPFSIAKTIGGERLNTLTYFRTEKELSAVYSPIHPGSSKPFSPMNVMIIIMESFSKEHIGSLNRYLQNGRYQGFTPFLDSLIRYGLYFDAYANGKTSIQGIPAILSGIPALMNESFIQSPYASGEYTSLAGLLKQKGYSTAFFHGGTNGTMGFDSYTRLVGFDRYYGRSEHNNEKDYDGKWGIRDEEFFQYTISMLDKTPEPFAAALFSLSSHHPYFVPPQYANIFRKGPLPIQQSVMYGDHALRRFFKVAATKNWYQNTLFVITADHTSEGHYPFYRSNVGQYAIPLLFYKPGSDMAGKPDVIAQQTDIMPTVLNYLGYDRPYLAFGHDLLDNSESLPRFSVHYITGLYGIMKDGYYLEFDGRNTTSLFDLREDLLQKVNLTESRPEVKEHLERFLKAYLQQYNNRLIENRLMVEKEGR